MDTSVKTQHSVTTLRVLFIADNLEEESTTSFKNKIIKWTLESKISSIQWDNSIYNRNNSRIIKSTKSRDIINCSILIVINNKVLKKWEKRKNYKYTLINERKEIL